MAPPTPTFFAKSAESLSSLNKNVPSGGWEGLGAERWLGVCLNCQEGKTGRIRLRRLTLARPVSRWSFAQESSPSALSRKSQKASGAPTRAGEALLAPADARLGCISLCCFQEFPPLMNAVLARLEFHLLSGSNNLVIRFTELARGSFSMLACDADPTDRVIGNSPCGPRKGGGAHAAGSTGDRNRRIEQRRDNSSAFYSFVYWPS